MAHIAQIMNSGDWSACFGGSPADFDVAPLVGWALVRDGNEHVVVGLIGGEKVKLADEFKNFIGYVGPGENAEDLYAEEA